MITTDTITSLSFTDDMPQWESDHCFSVGVMPTQDLIDYAIHWMTNYERALDKGTPWTAEDFTFAVFVSKDAENFAELRWDVKGLADTNPEFYGYDFKFMLRGPESKLLMWAVLSAYL